MDLCRLAKLPHSLLGELGLIQPLTGYEALYFDLSIARAARIVREFDLRDATDETSDKDMFGTLAIVHAVRAQVRRS